jgi:hypothetical protein
VPSNRQKVRSGSCATASASCRQTEVSGLQHSHNIALSATFRPTECPIGLASCLPRAEPYAVISIARGPRSLLHPGDRGLVSASRQVVYEGATDGGTHVV